MSLEGLPKKASTISTCVKEEEISSIKVSVCASSANAAPPTPKEETNSTTALSTVSSEASSPQIDSLIIVRSMSWSPSDRDAPRLSEFAIASPIISHTLINNWVNIRMIAA